MSPYSEFALTEDEAAQGLILACRAVPWTDCAVNPIDAEVHYELGVAFESDPYGCDYRAARRFRKAVALDPKQPKYLAALERKA